MQRRSTVHRAVASAFGAAIRAHCAETGDYEQDVAAEVGVSPQHLSNQMSGTAPVSVETLIRVTRLLGDASALRVVARLCGGAFVPVPSEDAATPAELADVIQAHAQAVVEVAEIYRDGRMDATEARAAEPEAEAMCDALVEAVLGLKAKLRADARRAQGGRAASLAEAEATR